MGLMDVACAIYLGVYMGILGLLCVIGYFKNFYGKENAGENMDA
jgi:hypothetical protein